MATVLIDANVLSKAASLLLRFGATEVYVFGSAAKGGLRPGLTSTWQSAGCHHPSTSPQSARLRTCSADPWISWIWMIQHRLFGILLPVGSWFVSHEPATKIRVVVGFMASFRHLFRGASIALMRWEKLRPLVAKVDRTYEDTRSELEALANFIDHRAENA